MRSNILARWQKTVLVSYLMGSMCFAGIPDNSAVMGSLKPSEGSLNFPKGSVYLYGDQATDNLMPVRVLGAVEKAGIHYVPYKTDLLTLITLAGGTTVDAAPEAISIKRNGPDGKGQIILANLESLVAQSDAGSPDLMPNDIVHVPQQDKSISDNTMRWITVVSVAASILTAVAVFRSK